MALCEVLNAVVGTMAQPADYQSDKRSAKQVAKCQRSIRYEGPAARRCNVMTVLVVQALILKHAFYFQ